MHSKSFLELKSFSLTFKRIHGIVMGAAIIAGTVVSEKAHAQYIGQVSSVVINARTGHILSAENPDLLRYPASLTKVMTLYMTFQALKAGRIHLNDKIHVSHHAARQAPSRLGLRAGGSLTVRQAIYGLVTKSANDAACALGEHLAHGNEEVFAAMMTHRAHMIGMYSTTFKNASGLPNPEQVTTARDLATLARHVMYDYPEYYHYFSTDSFVYHRHVIRNHNPMLNLYSGADGLKTGYTGSAGHNLMTSARRQGVRLVGVILGSPTNEERTEQMVSMLDAGFMMSGQSAVPLLIPVSAHTNNRRVIRRRAASRTRLMLITYRRKAALAHRRRGRVQHPPVHRVVAHHRTAVHRVVSHQPPIHRAGTHYPAHKRVVHHVK